jgi:hypothetical protein
VGGGFQDDGPKPREVEQALRAKVDTLVPELLTGATRDGGFWRAGSVDGEAGQASSVNRTGPRRGCGPISARPKAPTIIRATCSS